MPTMTARIVRYTVVALVVLVVRRRLRPLFRVRDAGLSGAARGIAFEVAAAFGTVARADVATLLDGLRGEERKALSEAGIEIGEAAVFIPALRREVPLRALLWSVKTGEPPGRHEMKRRERVVHRLGLGCRGRALGDERVYLEALLGEEAPDAALAHFARFGHLDVGAEHARRLSQRGLDRCSLKLLRVGQGSPLQSDRWSGCG